MLKHRDSVVIVLQKLYTKFGNNPVMQKHVLEFLKNFNQKL